MMTSYEFRWKYGYDPMKATSDEEAQNEARVKMSSRVYHEPFILRIDKSRIEIEQTSKEGGDNGG